MCVLIIDRWSKIVGDQKNAPDNQFRTQIFTNIYLIKKIN